LHSDFLNFFQKKIEDRAAVRPPTMKSFDWMSLMGLVAAFLVGITSVGSGSIVMMMLLLFYSIQPKVMVGTDIVHALILTGVTSFLHFRMHNNVDIHLAEALFPGPVSGGLLGSYQVRGLRFRGSDAFFAQSCWQQARAC
jgi:uncharacterized membrane protein YfcA